ncbi:M48 family metallopeptidase [Marinimicrobium alkaliphilum]|uniref:M48 family metallopeptidase n=1 Tax=Marinimicrobium alkaliphilum TaxID=2202654 RepID=UPI000DBA9663|nr:M48 family metallopeptidase [Marinimicrobium alkaliphilum]
MNFFEHQDQAKRNTRRLIVLFALAVIALVIAATVLIGGIMFYLRAPSTVEDIRLGTGFEILTWVAVFMVILVSFGSLYKWLQLRGGGKVVAEALGGRLINLDTRDQDERRVLNVVEEMAIASGAPVPPVYVLEEDGINAFAAGYGPQDAVIGVTRGCIRLLNRDELQGVVAHEFSHIFHGDMRLNMRLLAVLNGILLIGLLGQLLMRSAAMRGYRRSSSRDNSPMVMLSAGAGLMLVGYAGTFFGGLIKSAVSRQREYLADASAVQYTRNPTGIAGALQKIGGYSSGSRLEADNAAEFTHMFFGAGLKSSMSGMMATHPPLNKRIKRILPSWNGTYPTVEITTAKAEPETQGQPDARRAAMMGARIAAVEAALSAPEGAPEALDASVEHIGQPTPEHLAHAHHLIESLNPALREAAHETFGARGIIYGLLLSADRQVRQKQWRDLLSEHTKDELNSLKTVVGAAVKCAPEQRLPLVELALPALKDLSEIHYQSFRRSVGQLIRADQRVSLQEWSLFRILVHNLEPQSRTWRAHPLAKQADNCQLLLSLMARAGHEDEGEAEAAFTAAWRALPFDTRALLPADAIQLPKVDEALDALNRLKALEKPQVLKAMRESIVHAGQITGTEAELFRAIADSLDCPIPPVVAGAAPTNG